MTDLLERNALASAQTSASQVEMLVDQAMRISPAVEPVGRVNIAKGCVSLYFLAYSAGFLTFHIFACMQIHRKRCFIRQLLHGLEFPQ